MKTFNYFGQKKKKSINLCKSLQQNYLDREQPLPLEALGARRATHLVHFVLVRRGLGVLQPINLGLVGLNRAHLVAQHAQGEQPKENALYHEEDHQQLVGGAGVAAVAPVDTGNVLHQDEDHGIETGYEDPKDKQQEQFVVAHAHAVVHPPVDRRIRMDVK